MDFTTHTKEQVLFCMSLIKLRRFYFYSYCKMPFLLEFYLILTNNKYSSYRVGV